MATESEFQSNARVKRTDDQVDCTVDGSVVIMTLTDGNYFELNQVGSHIWSMLEQPATVDELVSQLLDEYEIDDATCRAEVQTWLARMHDLGLVVAAD